MVSFGWYNVPRSLKEGETIRLGFYAYNDTDEDLKVNVKVYQEQPSLKYLGSTSFTAYANAQTRYTSAIKFTMPNSDVRLHAEFEATGVKTGKKYYAGRDKTIHLEGEVREPPKASILKDISKYPDGLGGIIVNGQALPPGTYSISKGATLEYTAIAQNIGGPGTIWLALVDDLNNVVIDRAEGEGTVMISGTITVDKDMELVFVAGHGTTTDDTWGC